MKINFLMGLVLFLVTSAMAADVKVSFSPATVDLKITYSSLTLPPGYAQAVVTQNYPNSIVMNVDVTDKGAFCAKTKFVSAYMNASGPSGTSHGARVLDFLGLGSPNDSGGSYCTFSTHFPVLNTVQLLAGEKIDQLAAYCIGVHTPTIIKVPLTSVVELLFANGDNSSLSSGALTVNIECLPRPGIYTGVTPATFTHDCQYPLKVKGHATSEAVLTTGESVLCE